MDLRTLGTRVAVGLGVLFVGVQLVPYGRAHTNPPVTGEPTWDSPRTRELVERACFDCHSNQTVWPWYASVAPLSWSVQDHVDEGRETLNFSEWDRPQDEAEEAAEVVQEGEMPLWEYTLLHPEARLTPAEQADLVKGLLATFGGEAEADGWGSHGGDDDDDD